MKKQLTLYCLILLLVGYACVQKTISDYDSDHPERKSSEKYIGNVTMATFQESSWETKRLGSVSYDVNGNLIPKRCGYRECLYPMFVEIDEYEDELGKENKIEEGKE